MSCSMMATISAGEMTFGVAGKCFKFPVLFLLRHLFPH